MKLDAVALILGGWALMLPAYVPKAGDAGPLCRRRLQFGIPTKLAKRGRKGAEALRTIPSSGHE